MLHFMEVSDRSSFLGRVNNIEELSSSAGSASGRDEAGPPVHAR